jgi:hypothetical protein
MQEVQHAMHTTPDPTPKPGTTARADRAIRYAAITAVLGLAGIAAVVSYRHLFDLARRYGESAATAPLVPLSVDGLILVTSLIMLFCARADIDIPHAVRAALWLGIAVTLAANAAHGLAYGVEGALVSGWSAAALVIAYELLMWLIGAMRIASSAAGPDVVVQIEYRDREVPVQVVREVRVLPRDRYDGARWAYEDSLAPGARRAGRRSLASQWGITEVEARTIQEEVDAERDSTPATEPVESVLPETEPYQPETAASVNGAGGTS